MATGIKITKATYGAGSKTVDVKAAVSSNIKEGELNLVVTPDSLGVEDPAPGQTKQLIVSYTINNGDTNVKSAYDNEAIIISAPPAKIASGLDIKKAQYGYPGNMTDVTDAIRNYIKDGLIKLKVSPSTLGIPDPNPNKQKVLEVDYTLNGAKNSESIKDNSTFSVSAPPADGPTPDGPSIGNQIGWAVAYALMYSVYFIGIMSAFKYGQLVRPGVGYLFGAISVIPFGFFGVCFFAMLYPFWTGSKLDILPSAAVIENVINPLTSSTAIIAK
jgi:hypothetical protein